MAEDTPVKYEDLSDELKKKYGETKTVLEAELIGSFGKTRSHGIRWSGFTAEGALDQVDLYTQAFRVPGSMGLFEYVVMTFGLKKLGGQLTPKVLSSGELISSNRLALHDSALRHDQAQNSENLEDVTSPIELFRLSHTNKDGVMTTEAKIAYDAMMTIKNRPRLEGETEKTEVQIIEEVLKEKNPKTSSTGMFLANLVIGSISRKSSVSRTRIRELENKLAEQEEQSLCAVERYKQEIKERMKAQDKKIAKMKRKQEEDYATLMKAQEEKNKSTEKKQQELEAMVSFMLRTSQQQGQSSNSIALPS
ncbi:hypothetical protein QYE76_005286 [Lolium multiflorum]|uniref:Uncharacterized protein n=1 Tax=Lolium multiflorum TaxID=4521 RepID=A0AAD8RW60_LOLMU|nr:hypothetical protein QYE76_005286 [Lolium multiflorum]